MARCRTCRPLSFANAAPLVLAQNTALAIFCNGRSLQLWSPQGAISRGEGAVLSLHGCNVTSFRDADMAAAVPASTDATQILFGINHGLIQFADSIVLIPPQVRAQTTCDDSHMQQTIALLVENCRHFRV